MKTLRYRSISSALVLVVLSISLFTSCDKELEDALKQPDRLVKFTSLSFTGETASTTSNAGTGTFTGTGSNNLRFIPPEDPENQEIASALEDGQEFTDPRSTSSSFTVASRFTEKPGGLVDFDGATYDINYNYSASSDFNGFIAPPSGSKSLEELNTFIGIAGDFNVDNNSEGENLEDSSALLLYVFSYNKGTEIGSFDDFNDGKVDNKAFVVATKFDRDVKEGVANLNLYFATSGTVTFDGTNVILDDLKMARVIEIDYIGKDLGPERVGLSAATIETGGFNFDDNSGN